MGWGQDVIHNAKCSITKMGFQWAWEEGRGALDIHAWPQSYDDRPSHPYYAGTEGEGGVLSLCMAVVV